MRTKLDLAAIFPEERNEGFFIAAREINGRMQRVVDTMLQLAHLEGQGGSLPMEAIRLAPVVAETWAPLRELAEERKLKAEIHCPDDATVPGNADLWTHILANLFSNAVEYTPVGGWLRLDVKDDGIALSNSVGELESEDAARMFERFWRADGSRSDSQHSGLGLSLVQACAHDMGFHASASLDDGDDGRRLVISVRKSAEE
jgi:signal transduction histidine kinase